MGPRLTPEARRLIVRQRGVLASWQGSGVGVSARQMARATSTEWQRITPRTYLTSSLPASPEQLRTAALLEGGPDAALTGCSALIEHGWSGNDGGTVDVLVARDHRFHSTPMPPWLRWRSTTEVPRIGGDPRRAVAARAAVDAATWARSPRERMFILTSVVQQRIATLAELQRELVRRGRQPFTAQIRQVLDEAAGGVTSMNEADFVRECRKRGLPKPRMQVRRVAGGRRRVIDAEFRRADGRLVIVEIDGVGHFDVAQWHADLSRHNELVTTTSAIVLRVSGWQVRHEPDPFFEGLLHVLDATVCMELTA